MNTFKEALDILELNFYDNLLELKRIIQLNTELEIWNKKVTSGIDPNCDEIDNEVLLEEIRRIEELNRIKMEKISRLEFILFQEIIMLRSFNDC